MQPMQATDPHGQEQMRLNLATFLRHRLSESDLQGAANYARAHQKLGIDPENATKAWNEAKAVARHQGIETPETLDELLSQYPAPTKA